MFERFRLLPQLWRAGRLALRLLRDPRVPIAAKVLFGGTVLYMLSPIDVMPDWIPVLGQADDLLVLMAGLNLFLKACPKWLVAEHEDAMDGRREDRFGNGTDDRYRARPEQGAGPTIEGQYRRVG
jgi:uncharacterized membrane protein YkvA (DUF1232 family)